MRRPIGVSGFFCVFVEQSFFSRRVTTVATLHLKRALGKSPRLEMAGETWGNRDRPSYFLALGCVQAIRDDLQPSTATYKLSK